MILRVGVLTSMAALTWGDIRAAFAQQRPRVLQSEVAERIGITETTFSLLLNSDDQSQPIPEFAERVLSAIREVATEKAA